MASFFSKKFIWYKERAGLILCGYCKESFESFIPLDVLFVCFQFYYAGWRRFALKIGAKGIKYIDHIIISEYTPFSIGKIQFDKVNVDHTQILETWLRESISKTTNIAAKRLKIAEKIGHYQLVKDISSQYSSKKKKKRDMHSRHNIREFMLSEVPTLKTMIANVCPISSKPIKKSKIMFVEHICMKSSSKDNIAVRIGEPLLVRLPMNCKIKPGKIVKVIEQCLYPFLVFDEIKKFQRVHGSNRLPYYVAMVSLRVENDYSNRYRYYYHRDRTNDTGNRFSVKCGIPHRFIKGFKGCGHPNKGCALTENDNWKIKMSALSDGKLSFQFAVQWHHESVGKRCYNHGNHIESKGNIAYDFCSEI